MNRSNTTDFISPATATARAREEKGERRGERGDEMVTVLVRIDCYTYRNHNWPSLPSLRPAATTFTLVLYYHTSSLQLSDSPRDSNPIRITVPACLARTISYITMFTLPCYRYKRREQRTD